MAYKGRSSVEFKTMPQKQGDVQMSTTAKSEVPNKEGGYIDSFKRFWGFSSS